MASPAGTGNTIDELIKFDLALFGTCDNCRRMARIDLHALRERVGGGTRRLKLRCSDCGSFNCRSIVLHASTLEWG